MDNEEMERWREEQLRKCLLPMQEDISEWIVKIFDFSTQKLDHNLDPDNIYAELSSGEILCRFANLLIHILNHTVSEEAIKSTLPSRITYNTSNPNKSTISTVNSLKHMQKMENVHHFLNFCKNLGLNSNSLFESNDLVNHSTNGLKQQKQILICLLSLARYLHKKFNFTNLPELLRLEQDIEDDKMAYIEKRKLTQSHNDYYNGKAGIGIGVLSMTLGRSTVNNKGSNATNFNPATGHRSNTANAFYRYPSQIPKSDRNYSSVDSKASTSDLTLLQNKNLASSNMSLTRNNVIHHNFRYSAAEYNKCKGKILDEEIKKVVDSPYFNGRLRAWGFWFFSTLFLTILAPWQRDYHKIFRKRNTPSYNSKE